MSESEPMSNRALIATVALASVPCPFLAVGLEISALTCSESGEECMGPGFSYLLIGLPLQILGLALLCLAAIASARPGEKLAAAAVTICASTVFTIVMLIAPS